MEHFYQDIKGWAQPWEQGELFKVMLKQIDTTKQIHIAEIGVYQGRGTALINVDLINGGYDYVYHAIDHFRGSAEHEQGFNYEFIARANLSRILENIRLIRNESVDQAHTYPNETFDIVYIDASHDYESVMADLQAWYPKVKKGGIISGDDYCTCWPGTFKAVNEFFNEIPIPTVGTQQQWWMKKD